MSELFFFRKTVSVVILFAWLVLMTLLVGCSSKSLSQADKQLLNSVAIEPTDVIYSFNKNTILFNTSRTAWAGALGGAIGALIYEGLDDDSPENIILFQLKKDNMLVNTISQAFEYQIQNSDLFHVSNKDSSDAYFQIEIDGFQFHELNTPNLRLVSSCKASLLSTNNHRILWKGRESFTAFNKSLIEYPWEDYVNDPSKLRYAVSVVSQMLAAEFIKDLGGNPSPVSHALYKLDREKNKIAAPAEEKENKSAENLSPINEEKENKTVEKTSNKQTESTSSLEDKLSGLKRMYDDGLITKEEYDTKRKELLDRF